MKFEDKIYFLDDVLDEYEKRGGDREAANLMYWHLHDKLKKDISKTDNIVYRIQNFGNLYFTVPSIHNLKNTLQRTLRKYPQMAHNEKDGINKKLNVVTKKIDKMDGLIKKSLSLGVNNIWFFRKRYNPKDIKNG